MLKNLRDDTVISSKDYLSFPKGGYLFLIAPETGAWATISNSDNCVLDYLAVPRTVRDLKLFPKENISDIIDLLFYSGLVQVNGKDIFMIKSRTEGALSAEPLPLFWVLKYTNTCNLRCRYCYSFDKTEKGITNLPNEFVYRIPELVDNPNNGRDLSLCFHGGEPLLRFNDILECVSMIRGKYREREIEFNVQTNGTLLTPHIARTLKSERISIGISVDGYNDETNILRPYANNKSSVNETIRGIKICKEIGLETGIISVLTNRISDRCLEIMENLSGIGVRRFHFNHFFPGGRGAGKVMDYSLTTEQDLKARIDMLIYINDYNDGKDIGEHISERFISNLIKRLTSSEPLSYMCSQSPCGAGRRMITLHHDGYLYPCDDLVTSPSLRIGHINDIKDLRSVLIKSRAVNMCQSHCIDNTPKCKACIYKRLCISHCCSDSYFYTGKFNSPHSSCDFIQQFIPIVIDYLHKGRIKVENLIDYGS